MLVRPFLPKLPTFVAGEELMKQLLNWPLLSLLLVKRKILCFYLAEAKKQTAYAISVACKGCTETGGHCAGLSRCPAQSFKDREQSVQASAERLKVRITDLKV